MLVIALFLICCVNASVDPTYNPFIKSVHLIPANDLPACESRCRADPLCQSFQLQPASETDSTFHCHLFSSVARNADRSLIRPRLDDNGTACFGWKDTLPTQSQPLPANASSVEESILLRGPAALSSFTTLSFPRLLQAGCAYTLSLFVWIARPPRPLRAGTFQNIFHSRSIHFLNASYRHSSILPSILFNVGRRPDQFFFSVLQDAHDDFLGLWLGQVRYEDWIHLAITIKGDMAKFYIDGKFADYVRFLNEQVSCPALKRMNVHCQQQGQSTQFYSDSFVPENVIIKLGHSRVIARPPALVASLFIAPVALNDHDIADLATRLKPPSESAFSLLYDVFREVRAWQWGYLLWECLHELVTATDFSLLLPTDHSLTVPEEVLERVADLVHEDDLMTGLMEQLDQQGKEEKEYGVPDIGILQPASTSSSKSTTSALLSWAISWFGIRYNASASHLTGEGEEKVLSGVERRRLEWQHQHQRRGYYHRHPLGRIQGLYKAGRQLLHSPGGLTNASAAWQVALLLAEVSTDGALHDLRLLGDIEDESWPFPIAPHLLQPILLLLGYHRGYRGYRAVLSQQRLSHWTKSFDETATSSQKQNASVEVTERSISMEEKQTGEKKLSWDGPMRRVSQKNQKKLDDGRSIWGRPHQRPLSTQFPLTSEMASPPEVITDDSEPSPPRFNIQDLILELLNESEKETESDCLEAAAYYFPISQYTVSQYSLFHSGTGEVEDVRLESFEGLAISGFGGLTDDQHLLTEQDALGGDPDAQIWLAKKHFWGLGGLPRNEHVARHWFEQAAAQGHAEALYNVGVLHAHGQAGLPRNLSRATEYFNRSAHHPLMPFSLALHAMGNHYMYDDEGENVTLAKHYYKLAASKGCDDAVFSLAMISLNVEKNISAGLRLLATATSRGHLRASNYLSHALFDGESWLAQHGRERLAQITQRKYEKAIFPSLNESRSKEDDEEDLMASLPGREVVLLRAPWGQYRGACLAALPLLRRLSLMTYRPREVAQQALAAYLSGREVLAAERWQEGADLGLPSSQANLLYLCATKWPFSKTSPDLLLSAEDGAVHSIDMLYEGNATNTSKRLCEDYFLLLSQLANSGEASSLYAVAQLLLKSDRGVKLGQEASESEDVRRKAVKVLKAAASQGSVAAYLDLGWLEFEAGEEESALMRFRQALKQDGQSLQSTAGIAPLLAIAQLRGHQFLRWTNDLPFWWKSFLFLPLFLTLLLLLVTVRLARRR
eukprot:scaffold642_cov166-Ochromonas_danica.AAC.11